MKYKIFFKNYKYEFLALIIDVLIAVIAFLVVSQFLAFIISLIVFTLSTFFIIYLRTRDRSFYYYPFDTWGQEQDWIGRGDLKFIKNEKCFEITNSDVGFILPKTLNWDDYRYELDFKIVNTSFGFIVRAASLSDCVMYQIFEDHIKPHLRINGEWMWMDKVRFEEKLNLDNWYKLVVICEKRNVRIKILDQNALSLFDRPFPIPLSMKVNRVMDLEGKEIKTHYLQNIDFDFGAVGVRNYGKERALVKNIFIEKL